MSYCSLLVLHHFSYFRRQHQCTPIIPSVEIRHDHSSLLGLIFVDEMACFRKYLKLIFSCSVLALAYWFNEIGAGKTLHLPNHQFLVQAICSREQQQLSPFGFEELLAQADEPALPEGLGRCEIGPPCPGPILTGN